jgi:hypothetical protein
MPDANDKRKPELTKPSSPSGATDREPERAKKFDEEGGDQPQAPSERAVEAELEKAKQSQTQSPLTNAIDPHSMGSEGWQHDEPGQQQSPATFPQGGGNEGEPSRQQDETFPNPPSSRH